MEQGTYQTNKEHNEERKTVTSSVITFALSRKDRQMITLALHVVTLVTLLKSNSFKFGLEQYNKARGI